MAASLKKSNCEYVIFSFAFNPFINQTLTTNLIDTHEKFKSEYSFADGYPVSVSPELLDRGLVNILSELIKTKDDLKQQAVTKSSVFDLIKTDINSFEIETEISTTDWRLYRFDFSCDKKENYIACVNLYEKIKKLCDEDRADIQKICGAARDDVKVLKTIPGYFNIQIETEYQSKNPYCPYYKFSGPEEKMSFEKFKGLLEKINELNPDSVVSLSLWGRRACRQWFVARHYARGRRWLYASRTHSTARLCADGCFDSGSWLYRQCAYYVALCLSALRGLRT